MIGSDINLRFRIWRQGGTHSKRRGLALRQEQMVNREDFQFGDLSRDIR